MKSFVIKAVPHPNKGAPYMAVTWESEYSRSAVNLDFAEETLLTYFGDLDNLEILVALRMVADYKKGLKAQK